MSLTHEVIIIPEKNPIYRLQRMGSHIQYRRHDQYHRLDGPAILWYDGEARYLQYSELHRTNGPAIILEYNTKFFIKDSMSLKYETIMLIERPDISTQYWRHGNPHRTTGPAKIWSDGDCVWEQYGRYHRDNGPAFIIENEVAFFNRGRKINVP